MKRILLALALLPALSLPAMADCSSPAAPAGQIEYFTADDVFKYCDGTTWTFWNGRHKTGNVPETGDPALTALDDLSDVDTTGKSTNDVLTWDGTEWSAVAPAAGGGITVQFTTSTYNGNLGGFAGANAKCQSEFAGSYFCPHQDFVRSGSTSATNAWVDSAGGYFNDSFEIRPGHSCWGWDNSISDFWGTTTVNGLDACNDAHSIACCSQ